MGKKVVSEHQADLGLTSALMSKAFSKMLNLENPRLNSVQSYWVKKKQFTWEAEGTN